ncbi:MAG: apolipoprotein N-acyltransferase [Nocardioides sp.]
MLRRVPLALLAGLLLSLAYEPVAIAYLMPVAVAGFALATRGLRSRQGFLVGLAFGVAFYYVHIWWMKSSIGIGPWAGLAGIEAVFYGLVGAASPVLQRLRAWPFWLAGAWTTSEIVRSEWPFSGMPWGRLGFGVVDTPVASALAYGGINGVSFLVAAFGFLLARLVLAARSPGDERQLALGGVVLVAAVSLVPAVAPITLATSGSVTIAVVQGDVPAPANDILVDPRRVTQNHVDATVDLADEVAAGTTPRPDFVLWPENSTAIDPFDDVSTNAQIEQAVAAIQVPILVGVIVDAGEDHVLNQGIVWEPLVGAGERYTKRHPVAFGEYIPFRDQLSGLFAQLDRIPRDMLSGTRREPLRVAGVDLANSICFDIAYDDGLADQIERGADLLTVQTSNASFIFTDQIEQQFAMTRARAIESGRAVAVASTNGISGVIGPDGDVLERTDRMTRDVLVQTVDLKTGLTPGTRVSWAFRVVSPAVLMVGLLLGFAAYRRSDWRDDRGRHASQPAA